MKMLSLMVLLTLAHQLLAQAKPIASQTTYDAELAQQLGADEYGMKMYVMAFLKAGPNRDHTTEQAAELQKAHMANIVRMAEASQLVLAGPFGVNDQGLKGIYIFNVTTIEEAEALTNSDPAIQAGRLKMELIPWYGSAALMQVNEVSKTLATKSF